MATGRGVVLGVNASVSLFSGGLFLLERRMMLLYAWNSSVEHDQWVS